MEKRHIISPDSHSKKTELEISAFTIIKIVLVLFGIYLVYQIRSIISMVFVAIILAALIDPFAAMLHKKRIPRGIGVLIIYVVLFGVVLTSALLIIPPLLSELGGLIKNFSGIWENAANTLVSVKQLSIQYGIQESIQRGLESLEQGIAQTVSGVLGTIKGFFGGIASLVVVLVLTFYLVVEEDAVRRLLHAVLPSHVQPYLFGLFDRIQKKIGLWLRGEIILMVIVGLFSYVGLLILGVDYALILAIIAGLAELVPYAGPVVSSIPAILIAATQSPLKALFVLVLYFAIQQLENHVIVPKVMQHAVGMNPLVSILSLLVGFQLAGVMGALLAIPVTTALSVVVSDLFGNGDEEA